MIQKHPAAKAALTVVAAKAAVATVTAAVSSRQLKPSMREPQWFS